MAGGRSQRHMSDIQGGDSIAEALRITGSVAGTAVDDVDVISTLTVTIARVDNGPPPSISVRATIDSPLVAGFLTGPQGAGDVDALSNNATVEWETNNAGVALFNLRHLAAGSGTITFTTQPATDVAINTVAVTTN